MADLLEVGEIVEIKGLAYKVLEERITEGLDLTYHQCRYYTVRPAYIGTLPNPPQTKED